MDNQRSRLHGAVRCIIHRTRRRRQHPRNFTDGTVVAVLSILLQYVTGPMYTPDLIGFLLDYFFAFSVYGLASLFPNYKWFYSGVLITNLVRLISSTLSGILVWDRAPWASLVYNATYMIPTTILCLVLLPLVMPRIKPLMNKK